MAQTDARNKSKRGMSVEAGYPDRRNVLSTSAVVRPVCAGALGCILAGNATLSHAR